MLKALRFNGLLLLASTDGRSPTGHDRVGAVRNLGAAARAHPASWELALRLQIGLVARQAWMLGFGIQPLMSYSDGRTFRVCLQLQRQIPRDMEFNLGLMARCERCGSQAVQPLLKLKTWPECRCADRQDSGASAVRWIGALQDQLTLDALLCDAINLGETLISRQTLRLLRQLRADPGVPATVWATAELARRIGTVDPQRCIHWCVLCGRTAIRLMPVVSWLVRFAAMQTFQSCYRSVPACSRCDLNGLVVLRPDHGLGDFWHGSHFWVLIPIGLAEVPFC